MLESPTEIALIAIATHGACACRELRNEIADAARSMRFDDAQAYVSAARLVCGRLDPEPASYRRVPTYDAVPLII
jgi:cobalamin biosynthesis protein CobT